MLLPDLIFLETSALSGEGVDEAFMQCARKILAGIESGADILHVLFVSYSFESECRKCPCGGCNEEERQDHQDRTRNRGKQLRRVQMLSIGRVEWLWQLDAAPVKSCPLSDCCATYHEFKGHATCRHMRMCRSMLPLM